MTAKTSLWTAGRNCLETESDPWLGFSGLYLAARGVTLWWRIRGEKWIRLGAEHL